jgi:hypothetical protein
MRPVMSHQIDRFIVQRIDPTKSIHYLFLEAITLDPFGLVS